MLGFAVTDSVDAHPPVSNTGGDCAKPVLECGIDYLRGTVPIKYSADIRALLESAFDITLALQLDKDGKPLGSGFYKIRHSSGHGVDVLSLNRAYDDSNPENHCLINVSGVAISRISAEEHQTLFIALSHMEFSPTRIDIKVDDYSKTVQPLLAYEAAARGDKKGFRCFRIVVDHNGAGTFYAGRRGSDGGGKFLRIYDKSLQSDGQIDAIRVELELSAEKAQDAYDSMISVHWTEWPSFIRGAVVAAADFLDRDSGRKQACRSTRFEWWDWLAHGAPEFEFSPVRRECLIDKTERWIENQVAASIAMVVSARTGKMMSYSFEEFSSQLYRWYSEGIGKMGIRHYQTILEHWDNERSFSPCLL